MAAPQQHYKARIEALRQILQEGELRTQVDLLEKLQEKGFGTTQPTISRDLNRLGAIKIKDHQGRTVYRLSTSEVDPPFSKGIENLIVRVEHNSTLIVIHTATGSANLIARQLDRIKPAGILGTIAGDDTIFVALPIGAIAASIAQEIRKFLGALGQ